MCWPWGCATTFLSGSQGLLRSGIQEVLHMGKVPSLHSQKAFALSKHENSRDSHRRGTIFKLTILMKGITGKAEENIGIFEKIFYVGICMCMVCVCVHMCVWESQRATLGEFILSLYFYIGSGDQTQISMLTRQALLISSLCPQNNT